MRATTSIKVVMGCRMAKTVGFAPEPPLCVDPAAIPKLSLARLARAFRRGARLGRVLSQTGLGGYSPSRRVRADSCDVKRRVLVGNPCITRFFTIDRNGDELPGDRTIGRMGEGESTR